MPPSSSIRSCRTPISIAATPNASASISAAAISDYTLAISLAPNAPLAYYNRAWAHYLAGDANDALTDINRAVDLDGHSASAFSTRGLIRERLGDTTGAVGDFRQALKLDPSFQQPAEALQRLNAGPPKSQ